MSFRMLQRAAGLALLLLLAACSQGASSGATAKPDHIKIGRVLTLTYMVGFLADALGYYADAGKQIGVNVEVVPFATENDSITALASGQIDLGIQQANNAATANLQGLDLNIVQTLSDSGVGGLVVSNAIKQPKDLEGKTVGITGFASAAYALTLASLRNDGVNTANVKFVVLGGQAAFIPSLKTGRVDALGTGEPVISQAIADGTGRLLYNFYDSQFTQKVMGGPVMSTTLMTTRSYRDKYPQVIQALVNADLRALKWMQQMKDRPAEVLAKLPKDFQNLAPVFADLYARVLSSMSTTGLVDPKALETVISTEKLLGNIKPGQNPTLAQLYTNTFAAKSQSEVK